MLPWQHLFLFLGLKYKYFMGSLLSIPLHRLQLINFSATPGNKCCHGYTFFFFFDLQIFLWVLCFPYPCTDWNWLVFRQTWQQVLPWQHFFLFLGLVNIFMGSLLSIPLRRLRLISFSATPGNKCCHGNTFFCFLGL